MQAEAEPGDVFVTAAVITLLNGEFATDLHRRVTLRGITEPVEVARVTGRAQGVRPRVTTFTAMVARKAEQARLLSRWHETETVSNHRRTQAGHRNVHGISLRNDADDIDRMIADIVGADILQRTSVSTTIFSHALLREAIYQSLRMRHRRQLHRAEVANAYAVGMPVVTYKDTSITMWGPFDNPMLAALNRTWHPVTTYAAIPGAMTAAIAGRKTGYTGGHNPVTSSAALQTAIDPYSEGLGNLAT